MSVEDGDQGHCSRSSSAASTVSGIGSCKVCSAPRSRNSGYCVLHKRAYDNLYKQAKVFSKKLGGTSAASQAWDEIFGPSGDPAIQQKVLCDYCSLCPDNRFGKSRGRLDLASYATRMGSHTVVDDTARPTRLLLPALLVLPCAGRHVLGSVFLVAWMGSAVSACLRQETLRKLDYEAFTAIMGTTRNWSKQRAHEEWEALAADETIDRDNGGPKKMPLRLFIPSWMTCEDSVTFRRGRFESKELTMASRQKQINDDELETIRNELGKGHSKDLLQGMSLSMLRDQFHKPLPAGALTKTSGSDMTPEALLLRAAHSTSSTCSGTVVSPTKNLQPECVEGDAEPTRKKPRTAVLSDIVSQRNKAALGSHVPQNALADSFGLAGQVEVVGVVISNLFLLSSHLQCGPSGVVGSDRTCAEAHSDLGREVRKLENNVVSVLGESVCALQQGDEDLDSDFHETLLHRYQLLLFFMGKEVDQFDRNVDLKDRKAWANTVEINMAEKFKDMRAGEGTSEELEVMVKKGLHESEQQHASRLHEAVLRAYVKDLPLLPIEDLDKFSSRTQLLLWLQELRTVGSLAMLEELVAKIQGAKAMANQLRESVKQSIKDLKANIAKRERDQKKERDRKQQELEREKKKRLAEEEEEVRKRAAEFTLIELELSQHIAIKRYNNLSEFEAEQKDITYDKPFIINRCDEALALDAVADKKASTLKHTLDNWALQFPGARQCKGPDRRTQAPMTDALLGSSEVSPVFQKILPPSVGNLGEVPQLAASIERTWLYGYMGDMITHLPEPSCWGSCRIQVCGDSSIVAIPAHALFDYLSSTKWLTNPPETCLMDLLKFLKVATQAMVDKAVGKCPIYYGMVHDHSILVVPPGYLLSVRALNSQQVYGLRRSFLTRTEDAVKSLRILAQLHGNVPALKEDSVKLQQLVGLLSASS